MSCDLPVKIAGMPSKGCDETGGEVDEQWEGERVRLLPRERGNAERAAAPLLNTGPPYKNAGKLAKKDISEDIS
jgi:hypothetical protein